MGKYLSPLFIGILIFCSCSKKQTIEQHANTSKSGNQGGTLTLTGKKGSDFNTNTTSGSWSGDVINLKSNWFYTWGTPMPSDPTPQNIEFVPMFWGSGNVSASNIQYMQQLKSLSKVHYLLGFNEPDQKGQSNLSVDSALLLWPKLESINLPLGSPAASWPQTPWFYNFMDSSIAQKKRVDFICVHMYVGTDDVAFVQVLQDLYNKYHLPIWITEFATADWNANSISANHFTPAQVLGFMQRLLPKLEALPFVKRYSWFSGDIKSPQLWPSALVDASGNLTPLGTWYANYKS